MTNKKFYTKINRIFDVILAFCFSVIFCVPILITSILIKLTSKGPLIHWSKRVGKNGKTFLMAKFRTMKTDTPVVEINSLNAPEKYYIRFGKFFRKSGIDELPQIYNIFKGDMSFVGPRPLLYNHNDYIQLRKKEGLESLNPGLTGLAVIKGRNKLTTEEKVKFDKYYLLNRGLVLDIVIVIKTPIYILREIFNCVNNCNQQNI